MTIIRPVADADFPGLRACLDQVARERRWIAMIEAPPLDQVATFNHRLAQTGLPCQVAVAGGDIVGWCDIRRGALPGYEHGGELGLGVAMSWRGRGIGRRLLAATLAMAETQGLERIELRVYTDNERAIRLYEEFGFVREGLQRRARKLDGVYRDVLLMARLFDAREMLA